MKNKIRKRLRQGLFVSVVCVAVLLVWVSFQLVPENTPVARGAVLAATQGCIDCHGQAANPVPDDVALECSGNSINLPHARYGQSCQDLRAYFEAVQVKRTFESRAKVRNPNRLLQGERLARRYSCFQCHGELGQGGFRNAGALKGYIPGYFGDDFALLTRGGHAESIRAWIRQGVDTALYQPLIKGPIAKFFVERQAVSMPRFVTLPDSEIRILTDYVIALNQFGAMGASEIREYSRLTQQAQAFEQSSPSIVPDYASRSSR